MRNRIVAAIVCVLALHAAAHAQSLENTFQALDRNTNWREVRAVRLDFDTHHPQGMTRIGDRYYLSSVEVKNRAKGEGIGHLFEFDAEGRLLRTLSLEDGPRYHPSGIDYDGQSIWMALAEYRPDSTSTVYRVNPETVTATKAFTVDDHIGAILYVPETRTFIGASWGSRRLYRWNADTSGAFPTPADPANPEVTLNPSHYIDYQDVQHISGTPHILCSGLAGYRNAEGRFTLGGIDLIDTRDLRPIHQLPLTQTTPTGRILTQNPFLAELVEGNLHLTFIPEDNDSTMYTLTPNK